MLINRPTYERIIFGLKVRQLRQEAGFQFNEFSEMTGVSISYLNEIEKGKKYPQPDKLVRIAEALKVSPAFLASPELTKNLAPVGDLLESNFLNDLPLDLFGIELQKVVEMIAEAPVKVSAFIGAMLEIARNYSLHEEHFYFAALRAWQEMHMNYFEDIENVAAEFVQKHDLPTDGSLSLERMEAVLTDHFGYKMEPLDGPPELVSMRSVFIPKDKKLLLRPSLTESQRALQLAKELGFNELGLMEQRPLTSSHIKVSNFEEVLHNFKANYFAVAILINRSEFVDDLRSFFNLPHWDEGRFLLGLSKKYMAGPEIIFQRFNVMAHWFGLQKLFYLRIVHDTTTDGFEIDKELHLNRRHLPHANGLREHYCRRWPALSLSHELKKRWDEIGRQKVLADATRIRFFDSDEEYLALTVTRPTGGQGDPQVAVMFAIEMDDHMKQTIRFWDDAAISVRTVGVTCERCEIQNCAERVSPPTFLDKRNARQAVLDALKNLTE